MYKVYLTNYKPFWINSENKPDYNYFNNINFNWTQINTGVNYTNEQTISITINNLDNIYYKVEEIENNVVKNVSYFYFENVLRRLSEGVVVSCKLDYWATHNIKIEQKFRTDNNIVKFRRGHLKLNDFKQYPVFVDTLLNSINDWKSKNNPVYSQWKSQILKTNGTWINYNKDINRIAKTNNFIDASIIVDFANFYKKNYVFNKYFVVDYEGEYLLFPDFSPTIITSQDLFAETNKPGINEKYSAYIPTDTTYYYLYEDDITEPNLMRLKAKETKQYNNKEWLFTKLNNKKDMEYLINHSNFAAKKNVGYYYGVDLLKLISPTDFNLEWGIWSEYYQKDGKDYSRNLFFVKLPFEGKKTLNLFNNTDNGLNTINNNQKDNSYLSNAERDVIIGNTILKNKQLINNNYLLRFDNSGFKLFPINQTNIDLFKVIDFGDILPTQKDLYLEYVASVRNSVNAGYWTNYAQKSFQIGQKAIGGLFNSALNQNVNGAVTTIFNTVSNAISFDFQNSLLIANTKAKFTDMKNSIGINPQTSNIEVQNFYLIPQNWVDNNLNNLTPGSVVSYEYSVMDWLETTIVDINNLFLFYGFELNNSYEYNKIANQENFYFVQVDSEYLSREINNLYPLNIDYNVKINCLNEWTSGLRIFKKDYVNGNLSWTIR